jgi:hypothetical protein
MRRALAFVVVLVVAALAYASSLYSSVQQLDSDCAARIAAIGSPAATKKLKKEAVGLNKARTQLAKYGGGASVKDFRTIAKAGPMLVASGTTDAAILADVQAILDCFREAVDNRLANAQGVLDQLLDPPHIAFIKSQMALAKQYFNAGKNALPGNPVAAAAWFIKAYDLFGFTQARAQALLTKEQGNGPPAGVGIVSTPGSVGLSNASGVDYDVAKIRVFASVESGATTVKTYTGQSAKSLVAGFLAKGTNHMANGTTFDLYDSFLIPLATAVGGAGSRVHGRLWVFLKGEKFFVLDFDVTAM